MDKNKKLRSYMVFLLLLTILYCQVLGSYFPEPEYKHGDLEQTGFVSDEKDSKGSRENQKLKETLRLTQQGRAGLKTRQQMTDMMYTYLSYVPACRDIEETGRDTAACYYGITGEVAGERGPPFTSFT